MNRLGFLLLLIFVLEFLTCCKEQNVPCCEDQSVCEFIDGKIVKGISIPDIMKSSTFDYDSGHLIRITTDYRKIETALSTNTVRTFFYSQQLLTRVESRSYNINFEKAIDVVNYYYSNNVLTKSEAKSFKDDGFNLIESSERQVSYYTWQENLLILRQDSIFNGVVEPSVTEVSYTYDSIGNVIKTEQTFLDQVVEIDYEYDEGINPFYKQPYTSYMSEPVVQTIQDQTNILQYPISSPNNMVGCGQCRDYKVSYDENCYPTSVNTSLSTYVYQY